MPSSGSGSKSMPKIKKSFLQTSQRHLERFWSLDARHCHQRHNKPCQTSKLKTDLSSVAIIRTRLLGPVKDRQQEQQLVAGKEPKKLVAHQVSVSQPQMSLISLCIRA
jgi:hypothetical protein